MNKDAVYTSDAIEKLNHIRDSDSLIGKDEWFFKLAESIRFCLPRKITPRYFVFLSAKALLNLIESQKITSGGKVKIKYFNNNLTRIHPPTHKELFLQIAEIAQEIFPEDFAERVKEHIETINKINPEDVLRLVNIIST